MSITVPEKIRLKKQPSMRNRNRWRKRSQYQREKDHGSYSKNQMRKRKSWALWTLCSVDLQD